MRKFEYDWFRWKPMTADEIKIKLNELGQEGWECISVRGPEDCFVEDKFVIRQLTFYCKREIVL